MVGKVYIPWTEEEVRSLTAWVQLTGQLAVMSSELPPPALYPLWLTLMILYIPPSTVFLKQSVSGFIGMEVAYLVAICVGSRWYSNIIDTCKIKHRLRQWFPKELTFPTKPHDPCHWFIQSPVLGVRSLRAFICVFIWFNRDDTLTDSSVWTHNILLRWWHECLLLRQE